MSIPLRGLFPAAYTPMHEDGSLHLAVVNELAQLYTESRAAGVFVGGTTGECHSLSIDERRQLAEAWAAAAIGRLTVIVHVGSNCLSDAVALAAHARGLGLDGVAAMGPFFFKPQTVDDLVRYCAPIAEAAGDLPFYYYHIPSMTGVDLSMSEFLTRAAPVIPNLAGTKHSSSDLMELQQCVQFDDGRLDVFFGQDENLLAGLSLGVRAAIGSTYNYAAPLYHRVIEAFEAADLPAAQKQQAQSVELVQALHPFGVAAAGKALMGMLGVACGPVRPPLRTVPAEQLSRLAQCVQDFDFFSRPLQQFKQAVSTS